MPGNRRLARRRHRSTSVGIWTESSKVVQKTQRLNIENWKLIYDFLTDTGKTTWVYGGFYFATPLVLNWLASRALTP